MIYPQDKPEQILVYTKNNCSKCLMTKKMFRQLGIRFEEVNIENSAYFEDYVEMLKSDTKQMSMPVVYPNPTDMEPWNDYRPDKLMILSKIINNPTCQ